MFGQNKVFQPWLNTFSLPRHFFSVPTFVSAPDKQVIRLQDDVVRSATRSCGFGLCFRAFTSLCGGLHSQGRCSHDTSRKLGRLGHIALLVGQRLRRSRGHCRFTLHDEGRCYVEWFDSSLPALGLTIARYNIGGSANNVVDDSGTEVSMKTSDKMPTFKFMEAFWLDWMSKDPTSTSWNWDADAKQRAIVGLATQRDVDIVEAFSNSPPWWMTNNHATAGGDDGDKDNLDDWNHDQFALYLATVVSHARTSWGFNFTYVEAFNEPMSTWWEYPGGQEGCHFEVDTHKDVLVKLRSQLDTLGLQDVAISSSDENSPSLALSTLTTMSSDSDVMAAIGKVNTHGYDGQSPYRGDDRAPLKTLVTQSNKKFWDSEYGESDATGLSLAESIALDINQMGVSAFVYWQALDSGAWGLIQSNPGDNWIGTPNPKYYVLTQYSRHIRPGMAILSTDDGTNTVMAFDTSLKLLVLVTVNSGDSASSVTFDLSSFTKVAGPITAWTTDPSGTGALHESSKVDLSGTSFSASIPAASVMTFEVKGIAV